MANKLPMPSKLSKFSNDVQVTNYFKQLHDKVAEINNKVTSLSDDILLLKKSIEFKRNTNGDI